VIPLAVGFNLLWLRPGVVGGTESYATRLIEALGTYAVDAVSLHVFASDDTFDTHADLMRDLTRSRAPVGSGSPVRRVIVERTWLQRAQRLQSPRPLDLMHHLGGTCPAGSMKPTVVTIHDLQPLDTPTNFTAAKRRWLAHAIPVAVRRADVILTPSDWVGEQIVERFSVLPEKVHTVSAYPTSPDRSGDDPGDGPGAGVSTALRRGPALLCPAMTLDHKNHRMLFDAFSKATQHRADLQLICVGPRGRDHAMIVAAAQSASPNIHMLGYVSSGDLAALYTAVEAVVFPSRYEGFGLPVLEAQRSGALVIASSSTALPEVSGAGAILISPDDVDGWVDAMRSPIEGARRAELIELGMKNQTRYSARQMADSQLAAYLRTR